MAVLKTQCPECDAKIRLTVDTVGAHETECPKCGTAFTAEATAASSASASAITPKASAAGSAKKSVGGTKETAKASAAAGKKTKASAAPRRNEDDEDDDDAPKKKKKKKDDEGDGNKKLLLAGGAAGLLLIGGIVAVVLAVGGKEKPKPTDSASNAPPAETAPVANPTPAPKPKVEPTPPVNAGPKPPVAPPKKKDLTDEELATMLPDPPKIRLEGSLVPPAIKPIVKPPAVVPLSPEEDPFVRAKGFVPDGPLPELPKLPERGVRPILALDSGGHTAFVMKAFFTPDGKQVVTVSKDKSVRIWNPETGVAVKTIRFPAGPGEEGMLRAATLSRNGKLLAVGGEPLKDAKTGEVKMGKVPIFIVSPETGALVRRIDAGSDVINCMHFSNDGKRLAVGCLDGTLQVFDVNTGTQLGQGVPNVSGYEVKFNPQPNTNYIASLGGGGRVLIVDMRTRQTVNIAVNANAGGGAGGAAGGPAGAGGGGTSATPTLLAWSNDGKYLAVGCRNGVIAIYGLDGKPVSTLPAVTAPVNTSKGVMQLPVQLTEMVFMPNDKDLVVTGDHKFAGLVDSSTGQVRVPFKEHPNTVFTANVSPDGSRVVSCGGYHEEVMVWSSDTGKLLHKMGSAGAAVWAIAWSKDGKSIAWGGKDRPNKDEEERPLEHTFRLDEFGLGGAPDPTKYVQTVTSDEGVGLLKAPAGIPGFLVQTPGRDPTAILLRQGEKIYSATLLPKSNAIVAGGIADIYLINPATGRPSPNSFVGHTGNVLCVTPSPDGRYFATGSSDQTIRIWRRDLEEPLLNLFVAGREWIAWTPQGYYACSPQGEKLMAWQVNPGGPGVPTTTKAPQVHPAERFRDTLYKPAILKYLVPAGDLPRAMAMAVKFDKDRLELKNIADVLPPEVNLDAFGDTELKIDKDTLTVKATAKGLKAPIKSMRLLVDGRPFLGKDGVRTFPDAKPGVEATATWDVPLIPGTHTFAVIADTGVSRGMSKLGIGVRSGTPPKPNLYVLAMGVSDYPKTIGPLNFCATDAKMLSDAFQKQSKTVFGNIEVKLLTDKQCTKAGMSEGLKWLKSKMTPQDVGVVSFSGHGTRDPFGRFYLVPADMDPEDPGRTAFPGDVLKDALDGMPGRLVAILDACHSGMAGNDGKEPPKADSLVRELAAEDSGVIVMCASLGREYAIESKLTKAGFYTLGLVEGMSGHGDIDGDGVIYLHELDLYATTRVRQLSQGAQNPTFSRPNSVQPFPIARPEKPVGSP